MIHNQLVGNGQSAGLQVGSFLRGAAQSPASGWALGFIVAGALGLLLLVALLLAWMVARRRRPVPVAAPAPAPEADLERPPAPAGPAVWGALWVRQADSPVRVVQLTGPALSIGRDPSNDLALDDEQISDRHAELRHEGGAAVLYDLGSVGGTSVNHTPVAGSRRLSSGDVVNLGATELVYRPPSRAGGAGGRLVLAQGQSEPAQLDLSSRRELYIGCSESCDLVVHDDPQVSRRHARVQRTPGGHEIVNLESAAGVLVNGRTVSRAHLRPGDQLRLGDTEFLYER